MTLSPIHPSIDPPYHTRKHTRRSSGGGGGPSRPPPNQSSQSIKSTQLDATPKTTRHDTTTIDDARTMTKFFLRCFSALVSPPAWPVCSKEDLPATIFF